MADVVTFHCLAELENNIEGASCIFISYPFFIFFSCFETRKRPEGTRENGRCGRERTTKQETVDLLLPGVGALKTRSGQHVYVSNLWHYLIGIQKYRFQNAGW